MPDGEMWPEYSLNTIHHHVHAIGVLSANFNGLENQLLSLLKLYDGAPEDAVSFLFEKVPNDTRLEWLRRVVAGRPLRSAGLRGCIDAFVAAYKVCADNRNLIVHARIDAYFAPDDTLTLSKRGRSHGKETHRGISLETIRRVADEVHFWNQFGSRVLWFALRRQRASSQKKYGRTGARLIGPTTLPQISPPPVALANQSQS